MIQFKSRQISSTATPRLELTSLIDAVFILLIFFAVSSTIDTPKGIQIQLPSASIASPLPDQLTVSINEKGDRYIDNRLVNQTQLIQIIKSRVITQPDLLINIRADRTTAYEHIVTTMDIIQENGAINVSLEAKKHSDATIEFN